MKFGGLTASLIILSNVPAHFRFSYVLNSSIIFKWCKSKMLQVGFFFPVSLIVGSSASVVYGIRQVKYFLFCSLIYFNQLSLRKKKTHPLKFMSLLSKGDKIKCWGPDEWLKNIFQMHKGMTSDLVKKGTAKRERRTLIMVKINIKDTSGTYFKF